MEVVIKVEDGETMSEPMIIDLVFEGGGMKGVAFIGALRALATYGYRPGRLLGSSVGSLFATLLAAGYSASELNDQLFDSKTRELRLTQHIKPFPSFETAQIDASAACRLMKFLGRRLARRRLPPWRRFEH